MSCLNSFTVADLERAPQQRSWLCTPCKGQGSQGLEGDSGLESSSGVRRQSQSLSHRALVSPHQGMACRAWHVLPSWGDPRTWLRLRFPHCLRPLLQGKIILKPKAKLKHLLLCKTLGGARESAPGSSEPAERYRCAEEASPCPQRDLRGLSKGSIQGWVHGLLLTVSGCGAGAVTGHERETLKFRLECPRLW